MRKILLLLVTVLSVVALAGCSGGGDTAELQSEIDDLKAQVAEAEATDEYARELSVISAYFIWYDYYYSTSIFNDGDYAFNARLQSLIEASGDENSSAAYAIYAQADAAYQAVVNTLPKDSSVWTKTQYDNWVKTGKTRADALGQVGGHLFAVVEKVDWFNPE